MNSSSHTERIVRFGDFEADLRAGHLTHRGQRIRLQEKPFQILALLLERAGDVVTREELRQRLWAADTYVDFDSSVNTALKKLRHALGDPADEPLYIKTVPRIGYRFIAMFEPVVRPATPQPAPPQESAETPASAPARPANFFPRQHWAWVLAFATTTAAIFLFGYAVKRSQPVSGVRAAASRVLLFVMPFDNLSGDPGEEYFSDGLTDEMITQVGREYPSRLAVIARTSSMQYKGSHKPFAKISQELGGVDYVLEGSTRRSGTDVTVNAQLFRAADGASLWADTFTRPAADVVAIQHEVASRIVRSLARELLPPPASNPVFASTPDPAAYDDYLHGLYQMNKRTREGQRKAFEYLERAIEKDPHFGQAYATLAYSYVVSGSWGFLSPRESFPKAKAAAQKAIELDESLGEAHVMLGEVLHVYEWNWAEAEREYRRALELSPNSAMVHKMYAEYLNHAGRRAEALAEAERAQKLDPLSLIITAQVGLYYMYLDDLDRASQKFRAAVEIDPQFAPGHYFLGGALHSQHKDADAIREFELARKLSNDAAEMSVKLACAYYTSGRKQESRQLLLELKRRSQHEFVSAIGFAEIYGEMDDKEQTIQWLEKAAAEHDYLIMSVRTFEEVEGVGKDPRFQKILTAVAFPNAPPQPASSAQR
jgi:TolB-like protein/DNA-binding winged helix-turn-helix (wHTH) protein/cytochrome c-type biogenesis protein CcmH/NrfG